MTQYYSRSDTAYSGSAIFSIPFSYIKKDNISVKIIREVEDEETEIEATFTWLNDTQITVTSELQAGDVVSIRRNTPINQKIVTYQNQSMILDGDNLNLSQDQLLNVVQEMYDNNVTFEITVDGDIGDIATKVETAINKANSAISTANSADSKADTAVSTANSASTNASNAVSTANSASSTASTANTNASTALEKANLAITTSNTASTNASSALSAATTASTNASSALSTANTASTNASSALEKANQAVTTANTASSNVNTAVTTANTASETATTAKNTADAASAKVDEFGEDIAVVIEAAASIGDLDEKVTTATTAATTASTAATTATNAATTASDKADIATQKAQEAINAASSVGQSNWTQTDNTQRDYIKNKPTLATVATSGSYNDLSNTPSLATVATSGSYNDLSNTPTIPTVPTALSSFTDDLGSSPTHTHSQYVTDISGKEDILKTVNVLGTSGTVALTDNSINTITPTDAVTFTLPTVTDNTKFHQILVQVNLSTLYTLTLGTSYFFNKTAPDMSATGVYNLIYEYDKANQYWVVGLLSKGASS